MISVCLCPGWVSSCCGGCISYWWCLVYFGSGRSLGYVRNSLRKSFCPCSCYRYVEYVPVSFCLMERGIWSIFFYCCFCCHCNFRCLCSSCYFFCLYVFVWCCSLCWSLWKKFVDVVRISQTEGFRPCLGSLNASVMLLVSPCRVYLFPLLCFGKIHTCFLG